MSTRDADPLDHDLEPAASAPGKIFLTAIPSSGMVSHAPPLP